MENPDQSEIWGTNEMVSIKEELNLTFCRTDMCRYNLTAITDGRLLRKPTKLMTNHRGRIEPAMRPFSRAWHHSGEEHSGVCMLLVGVRECSGEGD